ncbi:MAG TPA: cation-efflux pump [Candidatus Lokiarchaeia archaeon]|nr:cation-efflux pump [Candidatus Lokiarchaeia archaeon]
MQEDTLPDSHSHFIQDEEPIKEIPPKNHADLFRGIRHVLWTMMLLNFIPTIVNLTAGYLINSLSLIADGFDTFFNAASNAVGLVGIWVAAKPVDAKYPYGRRKAETITALVICYLLFLTTFQFIQEALARLTNLTGIAVSVNPWTFAAIGFSFIFQFFISRYELMSGRKLHSDILIADGLHARTDVLVSIAVAAGLVFVFLGLPIADPILAIVVAIVIARIGFDIIKASVPTLMDKEMLPVDKVEQIVMSVPGVRSVHQVRSRGHEQAVYADLHLRVDPGMSTERAHAIAHEVGRRIRQFETGLQDVTIHVEPADKPATELTSQETIATPYRRIAFGLGASIHDLWVHEVNPGEFFLESHVEIDGSMPLQQAHELITNIENRAREEIPGIKGITSHLEPFGMLTSTDIASQDEGNLIEEIKNAVTAIRPDTECHDIKIRKNAERLTISLHVMLPGDLPLSEAHKLTQLMETGLRSKLPGLDRLIIHPEPIGMNHDSQEL